MTAREIVSFTSGFKEGLVRKPQKKKKLKRKVKKSKRDSFYYEY